MDDKFIEELKKKIGSAAKPDETDSFDLDSILKDFRDDNITENPPEIDIAEDVKESDIIDTELEKPNSISLTGVFEALHAQKAQTEQNNPTAETQPETAVNQEIQEPISREIPDEIEHARFFNTETFESIKEESHAKTENPITSFAKGDGEDEDVEGEDITLIEPTEEIDDYEQTEQKEAVSFELRRLVSSATLKSLLTFILMCLSGALFAAFKTKFSLPAIDIAYDISIYLPIMLCITILATAVNAVSLWDGFKGIFKIKCTTDSFLSLIFMLTVTTDICYLVLKTSSDNCIIFDFVYVLMLFFSILSKRMIVRNIYKNFAVASSDGTKMVIDNRQKDELVNDIIVDTGCSNEIVYAARSEFVSDFVKRSFNDFDVCNKCSTPDFVLMLLPLLISCANYVMLHSFTTALIFWTAALCSVTPLLQATCFALSLQKNGKKSRKSGGVIIGAESCFELEDVQTVVTDDSDIFGVSLNGIRFYGDFSADNMILYLNALYRVAGGPLKSLFSNMLSDDIKSLPRIDDIYYHESMGYSALIDSKVFLAGNKALMEHFGIEVDDSEYDIIYQQQSKHVLFAAYNGKLAGVFILSYTLSSGVKKAFKMFEHDEVCVVIAEHDENINEQTLFHHYDTNDRFLFKIMNFGNAQRCVKKLDLMQKTSSLIASRTGLSGLAYALHGCKSVKFAFKAVKVIKTVSSVIALALISFLAFSSGLTPLLPLQILAYQLLWSVPVLFVSIFSK